MAAVLAGGPAAVLSHRSAAALWEIRQTGSTPTDVTVWPMRHSRAGLRFHAARLPAEEVTELAGIPVTTPSRTLFDLAAVVDRARVERALNEAEVRCLGGGPSLEELLTRHPRARGARNLRTVLTANRLGVNITPSELEAGFLSCLDVSGLARPRTNTRLHGFEVDCLWPDQRVVVELDGHAFHATRRTFERDRARDRALTAAGYRVIRLTWRQLQAEHEAVVRDLRSLLDQGGQGTSTGARSPQSA